MAKGMELEKLATADEAIEAMKGNLVVKVEDPEVIAQRIMDQILSAESADDVLARNQTTAAQEIVDRPFTLNGVTFHKSAFKDGLPVFAILDATFLDFGERASVTTGMRNVCAAAAMLWKLDALPRDVVIRKTEKESAAGNHAYWMENA